MHEVIILIAKYAIVIPLGTFLFLIYTLRRNLKEIFIFTLASVVLTLVLVKIATSIHSDPRPFVRDGVKPYFASSTDNGFPSDHTVFSSLLAFILLRYWRVAGLLLALLSILIGVARVLSGVHHGQDIIAGVIIAAFCVYAGRVFSDLIINNIENKNTP